MKLSPQPSSLFKFGLTTLLIVLLANFTQQTASSQEAGDELFADETSNKDVSSLPIDGLEADDDMFADDTPRHDVALSLKQKLDDYRVSIDFPEMSLEEFLHHLQDRLPSPINLIIRKGAHQIKVPRMRLKDVSLTSVFNAIFIATEYEVVFEMGDHEEIGHIGRNENFEASRTVTVLNVSQILDGQDQTSLLSAIEIGLQMMGSSKSNVELKIHEETQLLFVKAKKDVTNVIIKIVTELGGVATRRESRSFGGRPGGRGGGNAGRFGNPPQHTQPAQPNEPPNRRQSNNK